MAVYEIKDPKPLPSGEGVPGRRRKVRPVSPAASIRPIDFLNLKREWGEGARHEPRNQKEVTSKVALREARSLITLINIHLEELKKGIHITLRDGAGGFTLDVHDCSDGKVCDKVAELPILIVDLPILLNRLQQEAGFLLDRKL